MKKQILIVTAVALTAVVILNGTSAATAQTTDPTVSSWGFPYQPAPDVGVAALRQNQRAAARLVRQPTMDASRRVYPDPGLANTGY